MWNKLRVIIDDQQQKGERDQQGLRKVEQLDLIIKYLSDLFH